MLIQHKTLHTKPTSQDVKIKCGFFNLFLHWDRGPAGIKWCYSHHPLLKENARLTSYQGGGKVW